jgi:hypothetical protein
VTTDKDWWARLGPKIGNRRAENRIGKSSGASDFFRTSLPLRRGAITVAKELLKKKLSEIAVGNFTPPSTEKVLVVELMDDLFSNYRQENTAESLKWKPEAKRYRAKGLAASIR